MVSPLELLTNRSDRQPTFLHHTFGPVAAALSGLGFAMFLNFAYKKPVWSGIQKHVIFTLAGGSLGVYFAKKRDEHMADRDAVLRHYIELHPEDFSTPERKKYADAKLSGAAVKAEPGGIDAVKFGNSVEKFWAGIEDEYPPKETKRLGFQNL